MTGLAGAHGPEKNRLKIRNAWHPYQSRRITEGIRYDVAVFCGGSNEAIAAIMEHHHS